MPPEIKRWEVLLLICFYTAEETGERRAKKQKTGHDTTATPDSDPGVFFIFFPVICLDSLL